MDVPSVSSATPLSFLAEVPSSTSDRRALAGAVTAINQSGIWPGRSLRIETDGLTHQLTIQLLNSETNEVMDQIPSELALRMAAELKKPSPDSAWNGFSQTA
jgi:uncharacterized FlaG/YvyC family protein